MTQDLFKTNVQLINSNQTFTYIINQINELLRKTTQGCIRNPMELNNITKKMDIILATVLCLKGDTVQRNILTNESNNKIHLLRKPKTGKYQFLSHFHFNFIFSYIFT